MKKKYKISLLFLITMGVINAEKIYEIKSAEINFKLTTVGTVMDKKINEEGKKRVIFDDYGRRELIEVHKLNQGAKKKVYKAHTFKYINRSAVYMVDFNEKKINRVIDSMVVRFGTRSYKGSITKMLLSMGAKKIGVDKVAGKACDVWEFEGVKQCLYKGFPLRIESDMMGLKTLELATKVTFNVKLRKNAFKLPKYPIYGYDFENLEQGRILLDKGNLSKMDKKEEENLKKEKEAESKEIALVKASKNKFIENKKALIDSKKCLEKADTLIEVNACFSKDKVEEESFKVWSATIKKQTLKEISSLETKLLPCVKKAQKMEDFNECFKK